MVEKLFWVDPYLTHVEATVTSVDGDAVTLDRTIAYAFSGGQASDNGTIGRLPILHAERRGREIVYTLPQEHCLAVGDVVPVDIDWDERYRVMRLHFAAEVVLELVNRMLDHPPKVGANITAEKARVDFELDEPITPLLPSIQQQLEALVDADLPIQSAFADEASERRLWSIEGFAQVPCGGTHLRRTGEVGTVKLRRVNIGRRKERVEIRLADTAAGKTSDAE